MTNPILIDVIGYVALTINLYSMAAIGESKLRVISAFANMLFIIYGVLLQAQPIVFGATIAVGLHIYRLRDLKKKTNHTNFKINKT